MATRLNRRLALLALGGIVLCTPALAGELDTRARVQHVLGGPGTVEDFEAWAFQTPGTSETLPCSSLDTTTVCASQGPGLVGAGITIEATPGDFLEWNDAGSLGAPSKEIAANGDALIIDFDPPVEVVGFDLRSVGGSAANVLATLFAPDDTTQIVLTGSVLRSDGTPVFFGWADAGGIGRIELTSVPFSLDKLEFGAIAPVSGVPAIPLEVTGANGRAHAINDGGRIAITATNESVSLFNSEVLMPPHPGGGSVTLCSGCFRISDQLHDIGPHGTVVGSHVVFPSIGGIHSRPAAWVPSRQHLFSAVWIEEFGSPIRAAARGINRHGTIVGDRVSTSRYPARWGHIDAFAAELPNDGPNQGPFPTAINDSKLIVGHTPMPLSYAALWDPVNDFALSALPMLPGGAHARALDVSSVGWIVGAGDDGAGGEVGILWTPYFGGYAATPFPRLSAGQTCEAVAISNSGEAVGHCDDGQGIRQGVVWSLLPPAVKFELAPVPGDTDVTVSDVNKLDQAVGWSGTNPPTAILWTFASNSDVPALPGLTPLALCAALVGSGGFGLWRARKRT